MDFCEFFEVFEHYRRVRDRGTNIKNVNIKVYAQYDVLFCNVYFIKVTTLQTFVFDIGNFNDQNVFDVVCFNENYTKTAVTVELRIQVSWKRNASETPTDASESKLNIHFQIFDHDHEDSMLKR